MALSQTRITTYLIALGNAAVLEAVCHAFIKHLRDIRTGERICPDGEFQTALQELSVAAHALTDDEAQFVFLNQRSFVRKVLNSTKVYEITSGPKGLAKKAVADNIHARMASLHRNTLADEVFINDIKLP